MAETAVNIVIDKLIPVLRDEVTLLRGVHGQITSIKDQFELIRAYVKDADQKAELANTSNLGKEWVKQVREVAFRIEDVMDEYLLSVAKRRQKHGLPGVLGRIGHFLQTIIPRHKITSEIVDIGKSIDRLNQGRETLGLNPSLSESHGYSAETSIKHDLRMAALFMDDLQIVGVNKTKEMLTDWLLNGESRRTVISVVGEGGLGKTTIVNNVYKKQKEKRSFDRYAWINASDSLKEEKLLKAMIQSFYEEETNKSAAKRIKDETMDKDTLIKELREYLQGRSYMIVFDDVRNIDFWRGVEFALPDNNKRSRIMITSRDRGVAEFCRSFAPIHIHELEPLTLNNALSLFHLKAFQFDSQGCPKELIELSQDFVKKCDGVPLAIVAIAGLLSTKRKNVSEWKMVYDSLRSKLGSDHHLRGYYQVLSESYDDLPYHLKLCLLYFGLFPEGYSIRCIRLINLWIAEGFVYNNNNESQTLEEVAEEYLVELIRRSLVKLWEVHPYGRIRKCEVHDLMHDFILNKCEEQNFCQVIKSEAFIFHPWTRRLSIHTHNIHDNLQGTTKYARVRSSFGINLKEFPKPVMESLLSSFKLLIALDFEDAPLDYLAEAIGDLLHLKYLNLRNTKIKTIPKFIGKLQNLETLDLKKTLVRELPEEINKLVKLRFLVAYSLHGVNYFLKNMQGVKLKKGIGRLRALQKLTLIDVTDGDDIVNELKNLKLTRACHITKIRRHQGELLCRAIESMKHLRSLSFAAAQEHEVLDLQSLNDPPLYLQRLYLEGRLEKFPEWIPKLQNLAKLRLSWSGLTQDPLSLIKDLPELVELLLFKCYEGAEMHFRDGRLRKLKNLVIHSMQSLRTLKIDKGALPSLEYLGFGLCPQLVDVPYDIGNLKTVKTFRLEEMPGQFVDDIDPSEGKSYDILKNIPSVICEKNGKISYLH